MKTDAVSTSKKKAGSAAKNKLVSASKRKPASPVKKNVAAPAKRKKAVFPPRTKPVSMAKKKLELHDQVSEFVASAFQGKRMAYFVLDTECTKEGAYIMCFAVEGEAGYYKLDWSWHCTFAKAKAETALLNKKLGLNEEDVNTIVISTLGPPARRKK